MPDVPDAPDAPPVAEGVRLPPMTPSAFEQWRSASVRGYAADKVRVGAWPADEAQARSERAFSELLPEGQATPGQEIRSIVDPAGEVVGVVWFGPTGAIGSGEAFIWDIEIHERYRGRGLGRAALSALEPIVRGLGYGSIGLHVFGDNEIARRLYRSSGYAETDITMRKRLG
ncbi:MAG: GNAT family N-acetyltransferase [Chloroflexota bacterium]|jgi:ribosomal protein S18 acetylase RimI-like enzyme|nr:GNAT family N-acetyltransferase [Chloroflexota bacterium]MDH5242965.1 GNAT family N-acetyltransferase [Chloroflexota bacterium]